MYFINKSYCLNLYREFTIILGQCWSYLLKGQNKKCFTLSVKLLTCQHIFFYDNSYVMMFFCHSVSWTYSWGSQVLPGQVIKNPILASFYFFLEEFNGFCIWNWHWKWILILKFWVKRFIEWELTNDVFN